MDRKSNTVELTVHVDTTELKKAIKQTKKLIKLLKKAKLLKKQAGFLKK